MSDVIMKILPERKKQIKKRGFKLQREAKEWEADFFKKAERQHRHDLPLYV